MELSPTGLAVEAVQGSSGNTEPRAALALPRNSSDSLDLSCLLPTLFPWEIHPWAHSTGFAEQKSPCFTQQIELSPSRSIPVETVCTVCVQSIPSRGTASNVWKGFGKQHSSRQQINAGPELVAGGWNLGKLGLK